MGYYDQLPKCWVQGDVDGFFVSTSNTVHKRAQAALAQMLATLKSLGHFPKHIDQGYRQGLFIDIFGVACELSLREKCRVSRTTDGIKGEKLIPTGELLLRMTYHGFPVEWMDKKRRRLEDAIPEAARQISQTVKQWEERATAEKERQLRAAQARRAAEPKLVPTGFPDLDSVMRAWIHLPEAVRIGTVAMVNATQSRVRV